jgi:uncharacterized membrane protein
MLKETVAKQDEELLALGRQQSLMHAEASETVAAKAKAESRITELLSELEGLQAEVRKLQEENSIVREDLS